MGRLVGLSHVVRSPAALVDMVVVFDSIEVWSTRGVRLAVGVFVGYGAIVQVN